MKTLIVALGLFFASCVVAAGAARPFVSSLHSGGKPVCSAVVLTPGVVLTADHCVNTPLTFGANGGIVGTVIARGDDRLDYALLSFPASVAACPCVRIADREAEIDEAVYVVGYPLGIAQVLTFGTSQGVQDNDRLPFGRRLVLTAPVAGGNSGGGVFVYRDGEYQLVGVLVEAIEHLAFAVPLADLNPFIQRHR